MARISIIRQPDVVRRAMRRLLDEYGFEQTPELAENAMELIVRLHDSGVTEEEELVELAALSGGKRLDEWATHWPTSSTTSSARDQ